MPKKKQPKLRSWVEWWDYDGPLTKRTRMDLVRTDGVDFIQWDSLPTETQVIRSGTATQVRYYATKKSPVSLHTGEANVWFYYGNCHVKPGPFARTSSEQGLIKFARLVESWGDSI